MNEYGGIEMLFTFIPVSGGFIWLNTDILATSSYATLGITKELLHVKVHSEVISNIQYVVFSTYLAHRLVDQSNYPIADDTETAYEIRIFIYDQYVSAYCNDLGVYWYPLREVEYPVDGVTATLSSTGAIMELTDVMRPELFDQREAVYVDYESNTESAIQSIVQQRPIEINAGVGRTLEFTYSAEKDDISAVFVKNYRLMLDDNLQMSSDGIVYWADVGVSISNDTAEEVGLITRMYRLSELNSGAIQAARVYQRKALEKRKMVALTARLDPRIECRDVYHIDLVTTGTQRYIQDEIIVEGITIQMEDGKYKMSITGRRKTQSG